MFDEEKADLEQHQQETAALEAALRSIEKRLNPNDFDFKDIQGFRQQLEQPAGQSFVEILRFFNHLNHYRGMRDGHPEGVPQTEWNALVGQLSTALQPVLSRKLGYLLDDLRRETHSSPKHLATLQMPYSLFDLTRDSALEKAKDRFEGWLGKPVYRFPGRLRWGWPQFTLSVWESRYEYMVLCLKGDRIIFSVVLREDSFSPSVLKRIEKVTSR